MMFNEEEQPNYGAGNQFFSRAEGGFGADAAIGHMNQLEMGNRLGMNELQQ